MRYIVSLFIISFVYAIARYVVFAPENASNLPVFVANKAVSMAAALCFVAAFLQQLRRMRGREVVVEPGTWFRAGVFGALAHIPMSLVILRPAYFGEFFDDERLSFGGEAVFLFGALTAGGIYLLHRQGWTAMTRWWLSLATVGLLFAHVLSMGLLRGMNINRSHAYLPPMWLLSLIGIAAAIYLLLRTRPGHERSEEAGHFAPGARRSAEEPAEMPRR